MKSLAIIDPAIRSGLVDALRAAMPPRWEVGTNPAGATIVVTEAVDVDAGVIAQAGESLRLVVRMDPGAARLDAQVPTLSIPNLGLTGVAEHAVALMMVSARQFIDVSARTRQRAYLPDRAEPILTNQRDYTYNWIGLEDFGVLYGSTVGLVGLGYIGQAVAARLRPFGVRMLYTQRTRHERELERSLGVEFRPLEELLAESDIVSLHHRFDDGPGGNDGHFGASEFERMKPGAIFVNTARGRLVDETALASALTSGHLKAAALDVFRYEPLPADHPFFDIPPTKLLLTPHVAGAPMDHAWRVMSEVVAARASALDEEETA